MFVSAACRGCGRPLMVPEAVMPEAVRCQACREKKPEPVFTLDPEPVFTLDPEPDEPKPKPPPPRPVQATPSGVAVRPGVALREPPPSWLVAVGGVFALALWVGPVAVSRAAGVNLGVGLLVGGLLAAAVLAANALIVFLTRVSDVAKVALMAGVAVVGMGVFFTGAYLAIPTDTAEPVEAPRTPAEEEPPIPTPPSPVPPVPPVSTRPVSHIDLAYRDGMTRLEDGPAAVTALALTPHDGSAVIGYADGSTHVIDLEQPTFEAPRVGPKGDGAVRRIQFDATGRIVYLTCENGFFAAQLYNAAAPPLKIPGERVVVLSDPKGDRFAAVRGGRLIVRYVPVTLVKDPPAVKAPERFVVAPAKSEVLPIGVQTGYPVPDPNPAFVAWHPGGQLLYGRPDGAIRAWSGNARLDDVTKEHKGTVQAWAVDGKDFATGDDRGGVGYWRNAARTPVMLSKGNAAITHLAFAGWGPELIAADAAGGLACWDVNTGKRQFEIARPAPVAAVCYGPADDLLLLPDGNGVQLWWLPSLVEQSKKPV